MGKILDIAKSLASELQLASRHGHWILAVSQAADQILSFAAGELNALAGRGLVPNGTELDVGQNPDNSIVINDDNIQLNPTLQATIAGNSATIAGSGISPTGAFEFLTQATWFVNATTGNDANDGSTALTALRTLGELARRLNAQILDPTMATLAITIDGVFAENLDISQLDSPGPTSITIQGMMGAASFSGTIDTGVRSVFLSLSSQTYLNESRQRGFFGCTNTAGINALVFLQGQSVWDMGSANALFWGSAGNLTTNALVVQNACGVMYVTKPTATGVAPGTDVVLSAAAAVAWAAIPALSAAPDNAYVNVRH